MTKKVRLISRSKLTFRIGVLLDSNKISLAEVDLVKNLALKTDPKNLLVFIPTPRKSRSNLSRIKLKHFSTHPILTLIEFFESILFFRDPLVKFSRLRLNALNFLSNMGHSENELPPQIVEIASIEEISHCKLDYLVYQGSLYSPQEIADTNSCSVISFGGDSLAQQGLLEINNCESQTSFYVARFIPSKSHPQILLSGSYLTQRFYILNRINLRTRRTIGLVKALDFINEVPKLNKLVSVTKINTHLNGSVRGNLLKYVRHVIRFSFTKIWNRYVVRKRYSWQIWFSSQKGVPPHKLTTSNVPEMTNSHFADPFLFQNKGINFLFAEEYSAQGGDGYISAFEISDQKLDYLGQAITENYHLSFPFIFRAGSNIYLCPETSKNKSVQIYKSLDFPLTWDRPLVLIEEIDAADPIILRGKNGLWYLLCTVDRFNLGDHSSELYVFYANRLDTDVWKPHALNPIIINPGEARNGGLVQSDGKFIRIAQSYGFLKYGEGYTHREIRLLSETEFDEREIKKVKIADFGLNLGAIGTHHFSSLNNFTATDLLFYN